MVSLTIQQRDLLYKLLNSDTPVVVSNIADQMGLTPRQVNYRLKPIRRWLAQHDASLKATPGVGIVIECTLPDRRNLLHQLDSQSNFHLVLTAEQRQQLFAHSLLIATEPIILNKLQYTAAVSRTTILKDLDPIEEWFKGFELELIRRPNYGLFLNGTELARRQALVALLWGDTFFEDPLTTMTYHKGLVCSLSGDRVSLPILQGFNTLLRQLDTQTALEWVAYAEAQQGGRFTDDAVLHLALAFSIQKHRVKAKQYVTCKAETLRWLETQKAWQIAVDVSKKIWPDHPLDLSTPEIASIAMHLLAGLRDHVWPGDLEIDPVLTSLTTRLMEEVAQAFATPDLSQDSALRDGLIAHIIPAIMRQRFNLWAPPSWSDGALSRQYKQEYHIARELALVVEEHTGVDLPPGEIDTLTLLLRAAFIRERPHQPKRVLIVCSSGMATAQLLVARLKARFPSLEILGVLSLRELTPERVVGANLLISTVPLLQPPKPGLPVIQVHPLLLPEDIETITHWLT